MPEQNDLQNISKELLAELDTLFGLHAGFRPVHAKGLICAGTFIPSGEAAALTRAPHAQRESTNVLVRFSNFGGLPMISDTDPNAAPRGVAIRFNLAPHVHTDIIGHTKNGFPVRTGEEFLDVLKALIASRNSTSSPSPFEEYLESHPKAKSFFTSPSPVPASFATESYFAVNAFKFTSKDGESCFGRFQILPAGMNEYLDDAAVKAKGSEFLFEEMDERLAREPIVMRIVVELAPEGATVNDATVSWENSKKVEFGKIELTRRVSPEDVESDRIIFDPIPRVDGIDPSDDPLIELRAAIYLLTGRRRRAARKESELMQK